MIFQCFHHHRKILFRQRQQQLHQPHHLQMQNHQHEPQLIQRQSIWPRSCFERMAYHANLEDVANLYHMNREWAANLGFSPPPQQGSESQQLWKVVVEFEPFPDQYWSWNLNWRKNCNWRKFAFETWNRKACLCLSFAFERVSDSWCHFVN